MTTARRFWKSLARTPLIRRTALRVALALVIGLNAVALGSCSPAPPPAPEARRPPGSLGLTGAGSTFASVLFDRWFAIYHDHHPTTFVTYDAVGSGEGVRRFIGRDLRDGEAVDFGASDSAMSDAQLAQTNNRTVMLPVTGGCVVLAYHLPHLKNPLKLSRKTYAAIFLGEVRKWNDARIANANPGVMLPDLAIARVVRQDSSGTTFAFTSHLTAISDTWRSKYPAATSINWPEEPLPATGNEGVAIP